MLGYLTSWYNFVGSRAKIEIIINSVVEDTSPLSTKSLAEATTTWDGARSVFDGQRRRRGVGKDEVDLETDEIAREARQPIESAFRILMALDASLQAG